MPHTLLARADSAVGSRPACGQNARDHAGAASGTSAGGEGGNRPGRTTVVVTARREADSARNAPARLLDGSLAGSAAASAQGPRDAQDERDEGAHPGRRRGHHDEGVDRICTAGTGTSAPGSSVPARAPAVPVLSALHPGCAESGHPRYAGSGRPECVVSGHPGPVVSRSGAEARERGPRKPARVRGRAQVGGRAPDRRGRRDGAQGGQNRGEGDESSSVAHRVCSRVGVEKGRSASGGLR